MADELMKPKADWDPPEWTDRGFVFKKDIPVEQKLRPSALAGSYWIITAKAHNNDTATYYLSGKNSLMYRHHANRYDQHVDAITARDAAAHSRPGYIWNIVLATKDSR
jgi:hypothetical protein